jgi:pimeloyl-ACP methyl ester carboxylesterase
MIVLVHGAFHGSWCWSPLVAELNGLGVASIAIDLPGRPADPRPAAELTFDSHVDTIMAVLDAAPDPVTLLGHSLAGMSISQAAERAPHKVAGLVYLCAYLPKNGQASFDLALDDPDSDLMSHVTVDETGTTTSVSLAAAPRVFYGDCSPQVVEWALGQLTPEPISAAAGTVHLTAERWGSVPRAYIVATQDRAISAAKQRSMIADVGVDRVEEMKTSHSPFLSTPTALAAVLDDITT